MQRVGTQIFGLRAYRLGAVVLLLTRLFARKALFYYEFRRKNISIGLKPAPRGVL